MIHRTALATDTYKISMAMGGRPLSEETFYLSYRSAPDDGSYLVNPLDFEQVLDELVADITPGWARIEADWLAKNGFDISADLLLAALDRSRLRIDYALPRGEVAGPREPILTITGPQVLVSWLEPLLIGRVSFQMQVATAYLKSCAEDSHDAFLETIKRVTCDTQRELIHQAIRGTHPDEDTADADYICNHVAVDRKWYFDRVQEQAQNLLDTGVDPDRFFEVGLRAATCMDQHLLALQALRDMGFTKTSNTYGALMLDMTPVGTLGHEGIMRWGCDDELAFRKHMDAMPAVIMLLDTNDTLKVGLPTALALMKEYPNRLDGVRPDSGDLAAQFKVFVSELRDRGIAPRPWIFEDGLDHESVARYEELRASLDYPANRTLYGLGGYFVDRPEPTGYRRGKISMVYKLSNSDMGPAMKFGNEEEKGASGKRSIPGIPVLTVWDSRCSPDGEGYIGNVVVADARAIPKGYRLYQAGDGKMRYTQRSRPILSTHVEGMVEQCLRDRESRIARGTSGQG